VAEAVATGETVAAADASGDGATVGSVVTVGGAVDGVAGVGSPGVGDSGVGDSGVTTGVADIFTVGVTISVGGGSGVSVSGGGGGDVGTVGAATSALGVATGSAVA
jgi:hypothetical protein